MSIPKYPAYKASGGGRLGNLPAHWAVVRLKNVLLQRITDGPHTTPSFQDDGVPFLSVDGIQQGELRFDGCRFISASDHQEYRKKALPRRDDLLMGKAASTGKIARVKVDFEFSIWSPLALIRVDQATTLPAFVEYALKCPIAQAQIDDLCTSNTQKNISMDDIPRLMFARPPLSEQVTITTFLDHEAAKIDSLVEEQRRLIALLKEKRQAVISRAVTKGLEPNVPMKDSGVEWLGKVPAHWDVLRVKAASTFLTSGPRGWSDHVSDDGALFVQSGDLTEALGIDFANAKRVVVADDAEAKRTQLEVGDVLVCITGAKTGKVAVCEQIDEPAFINQHICLIRPAAGLRPTYLGAYLHSAAGQRYFELAQYGLKQGLSLENVKQAAVPVPPRTEQDHIVDHVNRLATELDNLTAAAEMSIALLHERRAALISAAVTGKIDVRDLAPQPEAVAA